MSRSRKLTGRNTQAFRMEFDLAGFEAVIDADAAACEEAARPAAQAGAQVLYEAVQRNVSAIGRKSGRLAGAIYQAYSKTNSGQGRAEYHVSWNHKKAPHGHLLEFGHVQRYATYIDKSGNWKTAVRNVEGPVKKPGRRATQAAKDAYYLPLKGGPRVVAARPFVRPAQAEFGRAQEAMRERFWLELAKRGIVK